jgi:Arc/MetJ-type ribon-helix-helix transcriptional regulator
MPKIEVSLPDRIQSDIDRLVDGGEFVNRDQAVEELLKRGISAYDTTEESVEELENIFSQVQDERDPAMRDDHGGDDYGF